MTAALAGLLLLCGAAWADRADPTDASDVLVRIDAAGSGMEAFRSVIADAIQYKLTGRGLTVALQASEGDSPDVLTQAARDGNPVALRCRYSAVKDRLVVALEWNDLQKKGKPVTSEQAGPLNLSADSVVRRAMDTLISVVSDRIDELAKARAARTPPPAAPREAPVAARPSGPPSPSVTRRFVLATGFAPFIAVGPASYYFTVGYLPSVLASLKFSAGTGGFAIGLYAAANYFSAQGLTQASDNLMIAAGPDARYELGNGAPFLAFAHVSAGPAFLLMQDPSQGTVMDVTAYLKSGIGATLAITSWMGVSLSADYEIYFEMPYLIMGFTPTLMMTFFL